MTTSSTNNSVFRSFFEKQKLAGPNFIDWYRQLRIVLSIEDKLNYLEQPIPSAPVAPAEIQRNLEPLHAHEMLKELKTLFAQQAEQELLQTTRDFHSCRQELGTVNKLHAMLKLHEQTLPKSNALALHAIRAGKVQKCNKHKKSHSQTAAKGKNHGKGENKQAYAPKPKILPPPKKENPAKDSTCHECGEIGHWKMNCPQYLAELIKKKKNAASGAGGSGIFVIELNTILNRSLIYDTGCGTHICNTTQSLRASRKLKSGALSLYVGNGQRESVEAIGTFYLCLPSGLEIVLNNSHYAPSITRGVIFVSRLYEDGFVNRFVDNTIQVRNNVVYFCAIPRDSIFEIDLSNSLANESSVYAVSNKRAKLDLYSALLWHCRLGHISKKRIEKLQHDGLLNSSDLRAFKKCVSCMSEKIARKPYTHQVERAKDLLGLIHIDVCGPFKIMSRQEASYFVTFTDDFSREYMSQEFLDHLKDRGIIAHRTPPYTPQHSGVSEIRNRTLLDMVRSMMSQTTLPKSFWDYALETAARILNMVPTKKVEKTPYKNAEFLENSLIDQEESGSLEDLEIIQEEDTHPSLDTSLNHEEDDLEINEPQSDIVPIHRPESEKWLNAMNVEMQSMKYNEVLVLLELPPNGKTVGSKWLFKKKTDMDGNVYIYKARLVAKGYTQTSGIDYEETFPLVADIRAIRILIAIAAYYDYEICQMDVKTTFLNGYLNEEVYMEQPEGFVNPKYPNHVCKLKRSIYGLKQASRQWNKRFDDEIRNFGFTQNRDESCVYLKASGINITFLFLYVDDILIMGNSILMLQSVKTNLGKCFAMKDLGEAAYILGIKIYRDISKQLSSLCQSAYIEKILKRHCMENSKRGSIPMQEKLKLSKSQGAATPAELKRMQNVPYASAVGLIMYVVGCTRPDVAFAQNDMFLVYGGDLKRELMVSCYTDAGYLTDADDLKSQTRYMFVLNGGAIDWKSVKQSIFATSFAEAEYIAAFDASKEAVWVREFISGLGVVPIIEEPISMYCGNTGAIAKANESGITKGARHFRAKVYYL
uniref:Retrotransposon protein, putative, Ty1-copia subclass n=1 Tax=Tanacetum cinerariifolium TaxID=118510 RepID=A0A6L2KWK3_TANCI|nr:retrotransposon protein, putative, Ty1-copia subclass [Tanacetum cinerariifolium]